MVYGPRNPSSGAYWIVTGIFANQKARGEKLTIEGSGKQFRDFVHVKDVARWLILGYQSTSKSIDGKVINVGSGKPNTILEVA